MLSRRVVGLMEGVGRTLGYEDENSVRELPRLLGLDAAALPHLSKMPVKYAEKKANMPQI
eukprot:COSAG04_NODE_552_length_12696_cov_3.047154_5_plen_60_part_00